MNQTKSGTINEAMCSFISKNNVADYSFDQYKVIYEFTFSPDQKMRALHYYIFIEGDVLTIQLSYPMGVMMEDTVTVHNVVKIILYLNNYLKYGHLDFDVNTGNISFSFNVDFHFIDESLYEEVIQKSILVATQVYNSCKDVLYQVLIGHKDSQTALEKYDIDNSLLRTTFKLSEWQQYIYDIKSNK